MFILLYYCQAIWAKNLQKDVFCGHAISLEVFCLN